MSLADGQGRGWVGCQLRSALIFHIPKALGPEESFARRSFGTIVAVVVVVVVVGLKQQQKRIAEIFEEILPGAHAECLYSSPEPPPPSSAHRQPVEDVRCQSSSGKTFWPPPAGSRLAPGSSSIGFAKFIEAAFGRHMAGGRIEGGRLNGREMKTGPT